MIKKGDKVICIKRGPWTHYSKGFSNIHPEYKKEYIVEAVLCGHFDSNVKDKYLVLIGFTEDSFLIDNFKKVEDTFASDLLKDIEISILEEQIEEEIQKQANYLEKLYAK